MRNTESFSWPIHRSSLYDAYVATRRLRVLLAEDDHEMRQLLAASLTKEGYEVITVADGGQLLEKIGSQLLNPTHQPPVDVIVSDIRMPHRSGLDVLAGLRRSDWATPFVLITAFGDAETHAEADRLGAAAILDKPFELSDLKTVIVNLSRAR